MNHARPTPRPAPHDPARASAARRVIWWPALLVALGAGITTAHGLYEVVRAAGNTSFIAGIYPLITDGLALVAYAATTQLSGKAAGYAWSVVVLAAGVSGLAQATYLAGGIGSAVPVGLRFGIGAWPALAAAIVAHLLYLIAAARRPTTAAEADHPAAEPTPAAPSRPPGSDPDRGDVHPSIVQPVPDVVQPVGERRTVHPLVQGAVPLNESGAQPAASATADPSPAVRTAVQPASSEQGAARGVQAAVNGRPDAPAKDRAAHAAQTLRRARGEWPTVSQLGEAAGVSRGTAHAALQTARNGHHTPGTDQDDLSSPEATA